MDTPIIIIGLGLVVLMAVPLYYIIRGQRIDQKRVKALFLQHSQGHKYRFELVATGGRKVLGIDSGKKGLLFIDFNLKEPYVAFQDLRTNGNCQVAISNVPGRSNTLEKVEWIFMSGNGKAVENSIVFHDTGKNYIVPVYAHEELKRAQLWQEIIHRHI